MLKTIAMIRVEEKMIINPRHPVQVLRKPQSMKIFRESLGTLFLIVLRPGNIISISELPAEAELLQMRTFRLFPLLADNDLNSS